jgi:ABC-type Mn2+/Zn2+ transport system ATPase subunit
MTLTTVSRDGRDTDLSMKRPMIAVRDVTLGYGGVAVLRHVDLDIQTGEFLGIVGPNGSGKTTLIKAVLDLLPPLAGTITRSTERGERLHFGYVPQRDTVDSIFPISVRQIVSMGRFGRVGLVRRLAASDWAIVDEALQRVGIVDLAARSYGQLSGGQKQRTLIARALASQPDLLVLDEPTNGMDLPSEHALLELIAELHRRNNLTVVMITHLLSNVANYADRIAIIADAALEVGDRAEMLNALRLTRLYHLPVLVEQVQGRYVIAAAGAGKAER